MKKEIDLNKIPYFETKVVLVGKVKKCQHEPAMVIFKEKYAQFKCIKCGEIYETNILSELWHKVSKKGNWVNGENLDAIEYPAFCSFESGMKDYKHYGEIDIVQWNGRQFYELKELKQSKKDKAISKRFFRKKIKQLIKTFDVHILKGKVIIFEEEK